MAATSHQSTGIAQQSQQTDVKTSINEVDYEVGLTDASEITPPSPNVNHSSSASSAGSTVSSLSDDIAPATPPTMKPYANGKDAVTQRPRPTAGVRQVRPADVFISPPSRPVPSQQMYSPTFFDPYAQQQQHQGQQQPTMYYDVNQQQQIVDSPYIGPFYYYMPELAQHSSQSSVQTMPSPSTNSNLNMSPFAFYSPERPYVDSIPSLVMPAPSFPTPARPNNTSNRPVLISPHMSPVMSPNMSPHMSPIIVPNNMNQFQNQQSPRMNPGFMMNQMMGPPRSPLRNIAPHMSPQMNQMGPAGLNTNVYVRGLDPTMTDDKFYEIVKEFGSIVSAKAIVHLQTGECKGFGFVMYERESEARAAMNGLEANGYQVSFARVGPRLDSDNFNVRMSDLQDPGSTNVYISNLPVEYTETNLIELIKPQVVLSAKVLREANGKSRGVGFARLESRESAVNVITRFNDQTIPGTDIALQVRFADSEAQKRLKTIQAKNRKIGPGMPLQMSPVPYGSVPYGAIYAGNPMPHGMIFPSGAGSVDSASDLVDDMGRLQVNEVEDEEEVRLDEYHEEGDGGAVEQERPLRPSDLLAVTSNEEQQPEPSST
ncbi:hypothetical protein SmJEL517_g02578 [Synchytrium microbalum]|uniref:RRM domain-containing protein n=1 Tax=Synchytrium microbalum TaxID=1806994 RepID=A0A507C6U1_9FUNG|nr:uncharacterized protein SmJEL517_g02578 [Synchytrium microbalum]TPX34839.1 hypothetical protein SmJEL517_g02578 [Synchytrium microbalum]